MRSKMEWVPANVSQLPYRILPCDDSPMLNATAPLALSKPSEYPEAFPSSKRTLYTIGSCADLNHPP